MPCKCLTGCINKKCSCRAKGIDCTDECAYCKKDDDKYECFNLPGKKPPNKSKSKSNTRKNNKKNSKILINSDDENVIENKKNRNRNRNKNNNENKKKKESESESESENENESENESENEKSLVKISKELTKKDDKELNNAQTKQTIIINNYYCHNEYKQQNNTYTQIVNHNYELTEKSDGNNSDYGVNNLIKNLSISDIKNESNLNNDNNNNNKSSLASIPKLTESLTEDFLKFYWECLSSKNKAKYIEKYICSSAELKIQNVPFIGATVIAKRLEEAAPIKINKIEHKIFPIVSSEKKFSVTNINNKLLGISSSSSSTKNLTKYQQNRPLSSNSTDAKKSKGLVLTDPNLPDIGRIETNGIMMDCNGYTAQFMQNFYLVYNKITNDVQIKFSELKWQ